jgi:CBS domain containing-hemolysin-like protein
VLHARALGGCGSKKQEQETAQVRAVAFFESSPAAAKMRAMLTAMSIMRSHVSGLITLTCVFSIVLVTSCCEIGFLAPLSFSMHSAESIELRLEVVLSRRSF